MIFQYYGYGRFGPFADALQFLENLGLLDALIPFALIFAIFYAVMDQIKVLKNRQANLVVSLSVALITVVPHALGLYPSPTADPVAIINRALPEIALIVLAVTVVMILTGLLAGKDWEKFTYWQNSAKWIALVLVALVFFGAMAPPGQLPGFLNFLANPHFYSVMIIILVFGLVVWAVVFSDSGDDKKGNKVTQPGTPP
ncbi:hypothetical protein GF342_05960 [Candidatus Woesearchaeota archaeon]|nr:hypothetical protein [Candidatus Woesearchaeota archaeon]